MRHIKMGQNFLKPYGSYKTNIKVELKSTKSEIIVKQQVSYIRIGKKVGLISIKADADELDEDKF